MGYNKTMKQKYPWDEWADGEVHTVVKDVDFFISGKNFRQVLYQWATAHGKTAITKVDYGAVVSVKFRIVPMWMDEDQRTDLEEN